MTDPFDALRTAYERGRSDALDAAHEAVEAIPAPYKSRGDFETFGPYSEGRADFKDLAISAIDALRKGSAMNEHMPECPVEKRLRAGRTVGSQSCICAALRACKARVLDAARDAIAETHLPIPVIQCECGWGVNCPECGPESNRTVGHVCRVCCDDWGDHGYCDDMHNEDDSPVHHVGGEMWSGPSCPVIAAIDALRDPFA